MNKIDTLRKAADLIEERGHCKNRLQDEQGRLCLLGALDLASGGTLSDRYCAAGEMVRKYLGAPWISDWNNKPERTAEEVIDVLRTVANLYDTVCTPSTKTRRPGDRYMINLDKYAVTACCSAKEAHSGRVKSYITIRATDTTGVFAPSEIDLPVNNEAFKHFEVGQQVELSLRLLTSAEKKSP